MDGCMVGLVGGWMGALKVILRIAYSQSKKDLKYIDTIDFSMSLWFVQNSLIQLIFQWVCDLFNVV